STLSFAILYLPPDSAASWSRTGATIRHGPHHSAHASTKTGRDVEAATTSLANVASVTICGFPSAAAPEVGSDSFAPHLPHTGCLLSGARSSTRLLAPHCAQAWIAILTQRVTNFN